MTRKKIKEKAREIALKISNGYDVCEEYEMAYNAAINMAKWILSHQVKIRKCLRLNDDFDNCLNHGFTMQSQKKLVKKILDEGYFTINERNVDDKLVSIEMKLSIITDKQKQ